MMKQTDLGFELPVNFIDHPRYQVEPGDCTYLAEMPAIVERTILRILPRTYTIDPLTPFFFIKMGILPTWVVSWFMTAQLPSRAQKMTLFYRSLHAIEHFRRVVFSEDPDDPMMLEGQEEEDHDKPDDEDDDDDEPRVKGKGPGKGKSTKSPMKVKMGFSKKAKK